MGTIPFEHRVFHGDTYTISVCLDYANFRLRVDDYRGNPIPMMKHIYELAGQNGFSKIFVKARPEHWLSFLAHGYMLEGVFKGYFSGSDAYSMALYLSDERRTSRRWMEEDRILRQVMELKQGKREFSLPETYRMRRASGEDAGALAKLYETVFAVYPTPMHDQQYIRKVMAEGTVFFVIECGETIVSAASAEVNRLYHHAEMTDCATLPEHRQHGFMKVLIGALEQELVKQHMYCAYSLARALSFGMNAVFHQLGYEYTGRLANNCYIFDKMEDMNLWVKNLAFT